VPSIPQNPQPSPHLTNPSHASSPPPHLSCPTHTAFHHRASTLGALRCGKEHRRPVFPLFPAFPHARLLIVATVPRDATMRPSPAPVSPTRASRCDPHSAHNLPVQPAIETESGRPFTAKSNESTAARCRLPSLPAPAPPSVPPQPRAAVRSRSDGLDKI
jgi:hypothetical protein